MAQVSIDYFPFCVSIFVGFSLKKSICELFFKEQTTTGFFSLSLWVEVFFEIKK